MKKFLASALLALSLLGVGTEVAAASQQFINVGSAANDGTGDPLRSALTKANTNFSELYNCSNLVAGLGIQLSGCNVHLAPNALSLLGNITSLTSLSLTYTANHSYDLINTDFAIHTATNNPAVTAYSLYAPVSIPGIYFNDVYRAVVDNSGAMAELGNEGYGCYAQNRLAHQPSYDSQGHAQPARNVVCYFGMTLTGADGATSWFMNSAWTDRLNPQHNYAGKGVGWEADFTFYNAGSTYSVISMLLNGPVMPASVIGIAIGVAGPAVVARYSYGLIVSEGVMKPGSAAIAMGAQIARASLGAACTVATPCTGGNITGGTPSEMLVMSMYDTMNNPHPIAIQMTTYGNATSAWAFTVSDLIGNYGLMVAFNWQGALITPFPATSAVVDSSGNAGNGVDASLTLQSTGAGIIQLKTNGSFTIGDLGTSGTGLYMTFTPNIMTILPQGTNSSISIGGTGTGIFHVLTNTTISGTMLITNTLSGTNITLTNSLSAINITLTGAITTPNVIVNTQLTLAYAGGPGILTTNASNQVIVNSTMASATSSSGFVANRRIALNIGGTVYYMAAETSPW